MLSYKLKHLCSRVIASLSAFGLFSISGARADDSSLYVGSIAQYNLITSPITFSANYDYSVTCNTNGMENINAELVLNEDGSVSGCKFMCTSGYAMLMSGTPSSQPGFFVGYNIAFDGTSYDLLASSGCGVSRPVGILVNANYRSDTNYIAPLFVVLETSDETLVSISPDPYVYSHSYWDQYQTPVRAVENSFIAALKESHEDLMAGYEFKGLMTADGDLLWDENFNHVDWNGWEDDYFRSRENLYRGSSTPFTVSGDYIIQPFSAYYARGVLYAKWEPRTMSTAFDCGGSGIITGDAPSSVVYGDSLSFPTCMPSQSGLVFKGWAVPDDAEEGYVADFIVE